MKGKGVIFPHIFPCSRELPHRGHDGIGKARNIGGKIRAQGKGFVTGCFGEQTDERFRYPRRGTAAQKGVIEGIVDRAEILVHGFVVQTVDHIRNAGAGIGGVGEKPQSKVVSAVVPKHPVKPCIGKESDGDGFCCFDCIGQGAESAFFIVRWADAEGKREGRRTLRAVIIGDGVLCDMEMHPVDRIADLMKPRPVQFCLVRIAKLRFRKRKQLGDMSIQGFSKEGAFCRDDGDPVPVGEQIVGE